ncbi:MAG: hypothetical protein A2Y15_05345 [Clostridiales bacterium GWF2_36_10]|nr:MAG: hypothetical protein A2Y15_05345 [Clostridiales bacterium GWF2_36_10]HAN20089.1 hypothetical protein [Clostridiales bacterium]
MSYCVNCGVELSESEKKCPLCDVPVYNPKNPWKKPERRPYPEKLEEVIRTIDVQYVAWLATLILLIPCGVSLISNITINKELSWSLYVIGACLCLFVWVILPFLLKKWKPYLFVLFNGAATALYLTLINYLTNWNDWLLSLAIPLLIAAIAYSLIFTFIVRRKFLILVKVALITIFFGLMAVGIEVILNNYLNLDFKFRWSLYVELVCMVFGVLLLIINKRRRWKEEIRRRLFF